VKSCPRLVSLTALFSSALIGTPPCFAQSELRGETALPVRLTVEPKALSAVSMKTLPQATCLLHPEGVAPTDPSLKLFADDQGMIHFHVRPAAESDQIAQFEVECDARGNHASFPLHLRSNSSPSEDMPAPARETKKERPGAYVRPALSQDEALHLDSEELARRGYPSRPDPEHAPGAFASWLRAVSHSSTLVPPRTVNDPEIRHYPPHFTDTSITACDVVSSPETCAYSGYTLLLPPITGINYDTVESSWYVPSIVGYETGRSASAFWVGLGGSHDWGYDVLW
jgi:hypothetical protein